MTKLCSIPGCFRKHKARGYCRHHYEKLRYYGDPEAATRRGAVTSFIENVVLSYEADGCLIWPFCRNEWGYGQYNADGRTTGAHRYVCIAVHGEPPTPDHEASHICGKGHLGCVNPRHLRWATPQENSDDKIAHGTMARGDAIPQAKLTATSARKVFALRGKVSNREIARRFNISETSVRQILSGKTWRWATGAQQ